MALANRNPEWGNWYTESEIQALVEEAVEEERQRMLKENRRNIHIYKKKSQEVLGKRKKKFYIAGCLTGIVASVAAAYVVRSFQPGYTLKPEMVMTYESHLIPSGATLSELAEEWYQKGMNVEAFRNVDAYEDTLAGVNPIFDKNKIYAGEPIKYPVVQDIETYNKQLEEQWKVEYHIEEETEEKGKTK